MNNIAIATAAIVKTSRASVVRRANLRLIRTATDDAVEHVRKIARRHGSPDEMFGVKVADLKLIAKRIKGQQDTDAKSDK